MTNLLLVRFGSLVGLAVPGSIPMTSGGSMGFPKYRLEKKKNENLEKKWSNLQAKIWTNGKWQENYCKPYPQY